jgi:hypothetical protein
MNQIDEYSVLREEIERLVQFLQVKLVEEFEYSVSDHSDYLDSFFDDSTNFEQDIQNEVFQNEDFQNEDFQNDEIQNDEILDEQDIQNELNAIQMSEQDDEE